jgi:hypothetical protein
MTDNHPITPPPELVEQWRMDYMNRGRAFLGITKEIAQWGADQQLKVDAEEIGQAYTAGADSELEACCEWLVNSLSEDPQEVSQELRAARRPKSLTLPLTLKDQALALLEIQHGIDVEDLAFIRRALEALPND